ncbi:MAG: hypothetical protein V8Q84_10855 [Bilophila sp.]
MSGWDSTWPWSASPRSSFVKKSGILTMPAIFDDPHDVVAPPWCG